MTITCQLIDTISNRFATGTNVNWIRQRREELNLSQEELTARLQVAGLNISRAAVSHWEKERNHPPLDNPEARLAIAKALKLSVAEVLTLAGYVVEDEKQSEAARRAAAIIERLPADARELALEYLNMLEKRFVG